MIMPCPQFETKPIITMSITVISVDFLCFQLKHLLREADPGEDMSLDPILMDACGSIMHTLCDDQTHGEGA